MSKYTGKVFYKGGGLLASLLIFIFSASTWAIEESIQGYDCVIIPSAIVEVSTAVSGVLEKVMVDRSSKVKKGQLIAQLESDVELVDLDIAKAQAKMDAVVQLRKVSLDYDHRSLERVQSLHGKNMISAQVKDKASREAELANWRLQDAKDLQLQRKLKLKRAQAVLNRRKVISPIDGIVMQRLRHPGEYIEEQAIVRIAQINPLFIEVILPMSKFGHIKSGDLATIIPELSQDKHLEAKVHVVDDIGDAASGTFGVRLSLPNPHSQLPVGVKCQVQFNEHSISKLGANLKLDGN
jgi:HlyD family secretion protein